MCRPGQVLLPSLLDELGQLVSDHAPEAKRAQALDQVAALKNAATQEHPEAATLESVQRWFEAELPSLSGAVLSTILAFESRADEAGDEPLLHSPI
jgi:anti-sigma factor ChrR (cupin superfamily)